MGRQSAIVGQSHIDFIGHILSLSGIGTSNIPAFTGGDDVYCGICFI